MQDRRRDMSSGGDLAVLVLGLTLAASVSSFAGYKLMTGPTATASSDFRLIDLAANRRNDGTPFGAEIAEADPITTGSLPARAVITSPGDVPTWFERPGRPIAYKLLSVERNAAFVDVSSGADRFTYRVESGGIVPGIGKVRSIGRQDGRWQVFTERTRISERGVELMGEADADNGSKPGE